MSIEIIVVEKEGEGDEVPVFAFPDNDAAAGFIARVFKQYGDDVAVAVAVDGVPVEWSYNGETLTIGGPLAKSTIH